ncbi:MAG TPA: DsbA family oxidoreductase, partial [Bauldia sp.]|nr:DsbA family oxidoreductase [Bauldia sp.]
IAMVPEVEATVRWHPFQLDPSVPAGGMSREEYVRRKFGDPRRLDAAHARLVAFGRAEGVDYRFERITRSPNTIDAHRMVRWTEVERQEEAVEALFRAYFTEGRDVGDHAVLAEIGAAVGLDPATTRRRLATEESVAAVSSEIEEAYRIGVNAVPCFIIGGRYAVMGAEAPATIAKAIRTAAAAAAEASQLPRTGTA